MNIILPLKQNLWLYLILVGVFSLAVGSFLNVVIYRLPKILQREWREQCEAFLKLKTINLFAHKHINLFLPRSHCPHCQHRLSCYENIPLLSYIFLAGKCRTCKKKIALRYPLVELLTLLLSVVVAWKFAFGWQTAAGLVLTWTLIALTFIDFDQQLLPDNITLPMLWLGLLLNYFSIFSSLQSAVIGAAAGYLSLWLVYWIFKITTKKEGMGYGDFKLLAMLGAWFGWQMLPLIILLSALVGALVGIGLIIGKRHAQGTPIPYGPYLAGAGWIAMLWGPPIIHIYLHGYNLLLV